MNDDFLKLIFERLDKIATHNASIDVTLAKQAVQLEEHIRRTGLLEERVETGMQKFDADLAPIKGHVAAIQWVGKLVAGLFAAIATVFGVLISAKELFKP